jgi:serine/threonine protein kinase
MEKLLLDKKDELLLVKHDKNSLYEIREGKTVASVKDIKLMGKGEYGYIYEGIMQDDRYNKGKPTPVVFKAMRLSPRKRKESAQLFTEAIVHRYLSEYAEPMEAHSHLYMLIPPVYKLYQSPKHGAIMVMPKYGITLDSALTRFDNDVIEALLTMTFNTLHYLQLKTNFIHRDLHSNNIMIDTTTGKCYIIDFGEATFHDPDGKQHFCMAEFRTKSQGLRWYNQYKWENYECKTKAPLLDIRRLAVSLTDLKKLPIPIFKLMKALVINDEFTRALVLKSETDETIKLMYDAAFEHAKSNREMSVRRFVSKWKKTEVKAGDKMRLFGNIHTAV